MSILFLFSFFFKQYTGCHGRCGSQPPHLIIMQPSAPHHTIAPFLVWTADDLSKTKLANTALIYGALDGLRAAARGGVASQWRCLVMGHEAVTRTRTQHTRICCSHTFLLTWISHFGSHCSMLVSGGAEGTVWDEHQQETFLTLVCPSLPTPLFFSFFLSFLGLFPNDHFPWACCTFIHFWHKMKHLNPPKSCAVTCGHECNQGLIKLLETSCWNDSGAPVQLMYVRMCWRMTHCVEEAVGVISDRPH